MKQKKPKAPEREKQILSVPQTMEQPDGAVLDGVQGTLLEVGPYENKLRPDGTEYTAQSFGLGEWGQAIHGVAYDHKRLDDLVGKKVVLLSVKSRNGRYGGVTVHKEPSSTSIFAKNKSLRSALRVSRVGEVHQIADTIKTQ